MKLETFFFSVIEPAELFKFIIAVIIEAGILCNLISLFN